METSRFIVFTGGWPEDVDKKFPVLSLEDGDFVACADGGYLVCDHMGFRPDAVIGDFDSLSGEQISHIDNLGLERIIYPVEKDETDTLLCVRFGLARGFSRFLIIGGLGGDFGHTMANLQVLSFLTDMGAEAEIISGAERLMMADGETVSVINRTKPAAPLVIEGDPGTKFSVFSYSERCTGVFIKNSKYELSDATLTHSYPIGVSNEFTEKGPVTVSVKHGRLLVITG